MAKRNVTKAILEGIRSQEDSELQMYATEPSGAMGEAKDACPACSAKLKNGHCVNPKCDKSKDEACDMKDEACGMNHEVVDKKPAPPGNLDEDVWMGIDEMDLTCVECADKMRERKMTAILRTEAMECIQKFGKKDGDKE